MKIIYLHQYFNTPSMNGSTRSYEIARRMVLKGHDVQMITSWREEREDTNWFVTKEDGIAVHWLPAKYSNHMSYTQRIKAFLKFAFCAAKRASELKADLVFATSTPLTIALPAVYAAKKQKVPMVFEVRDLWPELPIAMGALKNPIVRFLAKKLERFAYRHSKAIIALSPGMKEGVLKQGFPAPQVAVIPNSCDNEVFKNVDSSFRKEKSWLANRPLIVYSGTFGLINGVSYAVDLARELDKINSEVAVLLVGDGKEFEKVRDLASRKKVLNKNLFIEKALPKKDIPKILAAADMALSLFIDKKEMRANSANKFFDALASSTPVIINYGGWQKDLIDASGIGLCLWQMDLKSAAVLIDEKINNSAWLEEASQNARLLADNLFDRDLVVDQLDEVLKLVLSGRENEVSRIASGDYQRQMLEFGHDKKNF